MYSLSFWPFRIVFLLLWHLKNLAVVRICFMKMPLHMALLYISFLRSLIACLHLLPLYSVISLPGSTEDVIFFFKIKEFCQDILEWLVLVQFFWTLTWPFQYADSGLILFFWQVFLNYGFRYELYSTVFDFHSQGHQVYKCWTSFTPLLFHFLTLCIFLFYIIFILSGWLSLSSRPLINFP